MRFKFSVNGGMVTFIILATVTLLAACGGGGGGGVYPGLTTTEDSWPAHHFTGAIASDGFELAAVDAAEAVINAGLTRGLRLETADGAGGYTVSVYADGLEPTSDLYLHLGYPEENCYPTDTGLAAGLDGSALFLGVTSPPGVVAMGLTGIHGAELPVDGLLCRVEFRRGAFAELAASRRVNVVSGDVVEDLHFDPAATDTLLWSYNCSGDYDQDSRVTVADLTPIGIYYEWNSSHAQWPKAMPADGNKDEWITVSDLTTIGQNYGEAITAYLVQSSDTETGTFTGSTSVAQTSGDEPAEGGFLEYTHQVESPVEGRWYALRAVDKDDQSPNHCDPVQYSADYIYNPPKNLVAIPEEGQIRLNWDTPTGGSPDGYACYVGVVEMSDPSDGVRMHTDPVTETTFLVPTMFGDEDSDVYFGVIAVYGEEESVFSNIYHYQPGGIYPPQNLSAAAVDDHVQLSWEVPATGTPTGYNAYIADNLGMTGAVRLNGSDITGLTYSVNTLFSPDDPHYFGVTAVYGTDESDYSNIFYYQPATSNAPANLIAVRDDDHIRLEWTAPTDTPPDTYNAYVAGDGGMTGAVKLNTSGITALFYAVSSVISPDEGHYFAVTANYGTVESDYSNIFYYDPTAETDPPEWQGGTGIKAVDPGDGQVTVEWYTAVDSESPPVTYLVYYQETASFDWSTASVMSQPAAVTEASVTGLTNGTSYTFGVRARDSVGNTDDNDHTLAATPVTGETPVDSGVWGTPEVVDDGGTIPEQVVGWFTGIDVRNTDGTVGVAHFNKTSQDLMYSELTDGSLVWTTETVTAQGEIGTWASMGFHPVSGDPCIAYHNASDATLEFAQKTGGEWVITTVDSGGDRGAFCSLAFDPSDDNPGISYWDAVGYDVKYAKYDGSEWDINTAYNGQAGGSIAYTGMFTDLAYNPVNGRPGIAFLKASQGGVGIDVSCYLAERGASSWSTEEVYAGSWTDLGFDTAGWANSVVYSPEGEPYVLTVEITGEVDICDRLSGDWSAAEVTNIGEFYGMGADYLYTDMVWHDGTFHWVVYSLAEAVIYGSGYAGWAIESGGVGGYPSVAISDSDVVHASYFDEDNGALRYAKSSNGTDWDKYEAVKLTDVEGTVGERASLEYHPASYYPMISYYDASNSALKYADKQPGSWRTETVRNVRNDGSASEMGLDASGEASIAFFSIDAEGGGLYVAQGGYGDWNFHAIQEFDLLSGGDVVGNYCSLAVNYEPNDNAGVSYYNASDKALEFQQGDGTGGFEAKVIDTFNDPGRWSSIAYNPGSKLPGVAYYVRESGDLYFSQMSGTGDFEDQAQVDSLGQVGNRCSLVYDQGSAKPWISYYDDSNKRLKVAYVPDSANWNDGGVWEIVDIPAPDGSTNYGIYSSMAWHPVHDRPAVAFFDTDAGKLWYVFIGDPDAPQAAVEVAGGTNAEGITPSLVFNPDTMEPGIAYHDGTDGDLVYVERAPS